MRKLLIINKNIDPWCPRRVLRIWQIIMNQLLPHHAGCPPDGGGARAVAASRMRGSAAPAVEGWQAGLQSPMAVLGGASASHYPARRLAGGGLRALEGSQPPPLARQGCRNQIEAAAASQPGAEKASSAPGRRKKCSPGAEKAPGAPETRKVDSICR